MGYHPVDMSVIEAGRGHTRRHVLLYGGGAAAATLLAAGCDPRQSKPDVSTTNLDPRRASYEISYGDPIASRVIPSAVIPYLLSPDLPILRIGDKQAVTQFWAGLTSQIESSGNDIFKDGSAHLGISIAVNQPRQRNVDPQNTEDPYNQADAIGIAVVNDLLGDPTVSRIVTDNHSRIDNHPFITEPTEQQQGQQPLEFRVELLSIPNA